MTKILIEQFHERERIQRERENTSISNFIIAAFHQLFLNLFNFYFKRKINFLFAVKIFTSIKNVS